MRAKRSLSIYEVPGSIESISQWCTEGGPFTPGFLGRKTEAQESKEVAKVLKSMILFTVPA